MPLDTADASFVMSQRPIAEALAQSGLAPARAGCSGRRASTPSATRREAPVATSAGACFATLARDFGGPRRMIATACASATQAIGEAFHLIRRGRRGRGRRGRRDGDADAVLRVGFAWLQALALDLDGGATSRARLPPVRSRAARLRAGRGRSGAGARGARRRPRAGRAVLGEIVGFGSSQDAFDLNRPPPDGAGAELCMRRALDDAGLTPDAIGAINAHGTGTRAGDPAEVAAIRRLLGERWQTTPVTSVKGAIGHPMAGGRRAGGHRGDFERAGPASCRRRATCGEPDDDCALDHVVGAARDDRVRTGAVVLVRHGRPERGADLRPLRRRTDDADRRKNFEQVAALVRETLSLRPTA